MYLTATAKGSRLSVTQLYIYKRHLKPINFKVLEPLHATGLFGGLPIDQELGAKSFELGIWPAKAASRLANYWTRNGLQIGIDFGSLLPSETDHAGGAAATKSSNAI
jgi:hypothetical protein